MKKDDKYLKQYMKQHLRECQLRQLSILEVIDGICRKHDIDYWLEGGTLLGAVRHGGFIPWDDDIDIAMRAEDLKRFCEVAPDELPDDLFLQTPQTDPGSKEGNITKVRCLNSIYIEEGDHFIGDYCKGVFVDIFPYVDYPDVGRSFMKKVSRGVDVSHSVLHHLHYYSLRSFAEFFWFGAKNLFWRAVFACLMLCRNNKKYIGTTLETNGYGCMHLREDLFPTKDIAFEGKLFKAARVPDTYLKEQYGDYMTIPPVEKRMIHGIFIMSRLVDDE